jgi:hypothetical protein
LHFQHTHFRFQIQAWREDLDFSKEDWRGIKRAGICICAVVQANLECEKEIYLVSSLPYIVLFVIAMLFLGLIRVLDIEQGFVVTTITRHVSRRP